MEQREEIVRLVEVYEQSGVSQKAFCQSAGLNPSRFGYWVRKVRKERVTAGGFVKVDITTPPEPVIQLELVYPNGVKIMLREGNLPLVSQLLRLY